MGLTQKKRPRQDAGAPSDSAGTLCCPYAAAPSRIIHTPRAPHQRGVPGVSLTQLQGSESSDAGLADEEEKEGQVTTGCRVFRQVRSRITLLFSERLRPVCQLERQVPRRSSHPFGRGAAPNG